MVRDCEIEEYHQVYSYLDRTQQVAIQEES